MKNQGISLISLIITIIVIIILAAIVIFTGLGTPDSAQFSAFTNDVDTVYMAVMDKFADLKVQHAANGEYRTNEQLYIEVAGSKYGTDQYTYMQTDSVLKGSSGESIAEKQEDEPSTNCILIDNATGSNTTALKITLPKVRQDNTHWYIMSDGRVFNETGFIYDGKTYVNASFYFTGETTTDHETQRATNIAAKMMSGTYNMGAAEDSASGS